MGAGISGNYSNTKGSAPVTRTGNVRYNQKKTEGYLLNTEHPKGGSKAKFMKDVLGYTQSDSHLFHKNVVDAITNKTPEKTVNTPYGLRHTYHTELIGKNGNKVKANVVVVIQKDNGRTTYKIVTVYPDKKEK
jgi:hypothetical protein